MPHPYHFDPVRCARVAGAFYLAIIALVLFGELAVRGSLVVGGDAAATLARIGASPGLWRAGIVGDLLMQLCDLPMIVIFYLLLRPVHPGLALLAAASNLVQTAVLVANKLHLVWPLMLLNTSGALGALTEPQRAALALASISAHGYGFGIGLIFFGVACAAYGLLFFRSGLVPRVLGVLMGVAGLCYLVNSFALLLWPALAGALFPLILLPAFVAELSLALWLLVKGVRSPRLASPLPQGAGVATKPIER